MENYIAEFQNGNFQNKNEFIDCFVKSVSVDGCRTFAAVCGHKDFELLNDFFASGDEESLYVFLAYVKESLSLQVIPYLLALLEKWEETDLGIRIHYGVLTKELITVAMSCKSRNRPFNGGTVSDILSNSFGITCPVSDRDIVTDEKVAQIFGFVKKIAEINPEAGSKYYFGYKIE